MEIIKTVSVTKRYANHVALASVNLDVPEGSIFGLLGPNGAGKTSLIRIINMITAPDSGEVLLRGSKLSPTHKEMIGYLPEERGLYKKMKVGEQALYLAQLKGLSRNDAQKKLKFWFDKFDISAWWNRKVEELSKGMQQKVQFIVTVLHEPSLLIFDEPFSGFDPINASLVKDEILRLKENGASIIFSTHNMASVEELCDHIALINKSKLILSGKVKDIRNAYKTNTFFIEAEVPGGDLGHIIQDRFTIIDATTEDGLVKANIRLGQGESPNALLSALLPHCIIHGMHEVIPTMNNIFISQVNEDTRPEQVSSGLTE